MAFLGLAALHANADAVFISVPATTSTMGRDCGPDCHGMVMDVGWKFVMVV